MSKNNSVAPRSCMGAPVASVGPTADYYHERVVFYVSECARAMRAGDIARANDMYERGVNAVMNHKWHANLAKLVGPELSIMKKVPQ